MFDTNSYSQLGHIDQQSGHYNYKEIGHKMNVRISGLLQQRIGDLLEANGMRSVLSISKCCHNSEERYLHRIEISQQKGRRHFLWKCLNKR